MRILDEITDKPLKNVLLYLTFTEALELRDSLNELLNKPLNNHSHIPSETFDKEITVCIYEMSNLNDFDERSKDLIL